MSKKACKSEKKEKLSRAKYSCKKCGLTALKEKHLCKPKEL